MYPSKRIDFFIIRKCLNRCVFCSEHLKLDGSELTLTQAKKVLRQEREKGAELVHLVGGEPTIHSKFFAIMKFAKSLGYNIFIVTNVIMFSSKKFCEKSLPYLDEIMCSVHGHNAKIHNANTRNPKAFKKVLEGLENIVDGFTGRLEATTTITKLNYRYLTEIAKFINKFHIKEYQCMSIVPTGEGEQSFFKIAVSLTDLKPELRRVIKYCDNKKIKIRFVGIPMCILGDKYEYSHDLWEPFKINNEETWNDEIELWKKPGDERQDFKIDLGRIKTAKCKKCAKRHICGGICKKYYRKYGDFELKSFKK